MKHGLANLDEPRPDNRKTGLRAACNVLSTHLGIPKVERWAAPLVRANLLPRTGEGFCADDAVMLLLAVMASLTPPDDGERVIDLHGAVLAEAILVSEISITGMSSHERCNAETLLNLPATPGDVLASDIEEIAAGYPGCVADISVGLGVPEVLIESAAPPSGALRQHYRLVYRGDTEAGADGMETWNKVSGAVLRSLAAVMHGTVRPAAESHSTAVH